MSDTLQFNDLPLHQGLLNTLEKLEYQTPTDIQQQTIPHLLNGEDVLGQAQTGTGKTAAFALPILSNLSLNSAKPQALVLTPTRELAIQVAESFERYGSHLQQLKVAILCGGQDYRKQLRGLKHKAQIIVGTPGRVMDHMRRESLDVSALNTLVLDEADEMLRMGFLEDVQWILEQTPQDRQTALFSATMPNAVKTIARRHLIEPKEITVKVKTVTGKDIEQFYLPIKGRDKTDGLLRILEAEEPTATIIFVRTKTMTQSLAKDLNYHGHRAIALNGDMSQQLREQTIKELTKGKTNILVATDVAARGLDIKHVSLVVNYDAPQEPESYVHRIGRTGRAGRTGKAILFLAPNERYLLRQIERATKDKLAEMSLPSTKALNQKRIEQFKASITTTLDNPSIGFFQKIIKEYQQEADVDALQIAAALALQCKGGKSFLFKELATRSHSGQKDSKDYGRKRRFNKPFKAKGDHKKSFGSKAGKSFGSKAGKPFDGHSKPRKKQPNPA